MFREYSLNLESSIPLIVAIKIKGIFGASPNSVVIWEYVDSINTKNVGNAYLYAASFTYCSSEFPDVLSPWELLLLVVSYLAVFLSCMV